MTTGDGVMSETPLHGEHVGLRVFPTRTGAWGIRQFKKGEPTGGGTVGLGWATREEAEANNPPFGMYTFEAFDRYSSGPPTACIADDAMKAEVNSRG